jgi:hypothetical protein
MAGSLPDGTPLYQAAGYSDELFSTARTAR